MGHLFNTGQFRRRSFLGIPLPPCGGGLGWGVALSSSSNRETGKRRYLILALGVAAAIACSTWLLGLGGLLAFVENFTLDARIGAFPVRPDPDLVIVDIDQYSLARSGQWPWRRGIHAAMLDKLMGWEARLVVFDVLFTSPSGRPEEDAALIRAVRRAGPSRVVLAGVWGGLGAGADGVVRRLLERPLPQFQVGHGTADFPVDSDGTVRRAPRLVNEGEPSLALAALHILDPAQAVAVDRRWMSGGQIMPLAGGASAYATVSYANVLEGVIDPRIDPNLVQSSRSYRDYAALFKGKIVFIGSSDETLHDIFTAATTRGGSQMPGVELQANLLAALRRDDLVHPVSPALSFLVTLLLTLVTSLALGSLPWAAALALALSAGVLYLVAVFALYAYAHIAAGVSVPLVAQASTLAVLLTARLWSEEHEKRRVRATFGRYVSPRVIDALLRDPERYSLVVAERRQVTVLFMDIAGFTSFSERAPAEQVREVLNGYLRAMTACVLAEDGVLDKYMGDGIMAVWGNLGISDTSEDARRALRAALAMQRRLADLGQGWQAQGLPALTARIGIHSGEALAGNFGSDLKMDFTVVGDVVNTASRLEALNKSYGTAIMVSGETTSLAGNEFRFQPLGTSAIRGRAGSVEVYELVSEVRVSSSPVS